MFSVDSRDQRVLGDILQMTFVLEPRARGGDVVRRTLALHLDEDTQILKVLSIPWSKSIQTLQARRRWINAHIDAQVWLWNSRRLHHVVLEAGRGEAFALRGTKLERSAICRQKTICQGIECQRLAKCHGSHDFRRTQKVVGLLVAIVASSEVAVEG